MSTLVLCPACQRHVRSEEMECPFCHAAITPEAREAAARPLPPAGVPRAKLYAITAAVAAGVAAVACGSDDTSGTTAQTGGSSGTAEAGGASGTAQAGGASGTAQAGGASGSAQAGGAAGSTQQAGGAAGAVADSGATDGQGGTVKDAATIDVPLAHPYGCVFADPSRTTKV